MHVLAVTGGIGAGKTTAVEFLRAQGAEVISLDEVARELLALGSPVHRAVVEEFGREILADGGLIDTVKLARSAFSSATRAKRLNAIIHPEVLRETRVALAEMSQRPDPPRVVVIDIPLLVESPDFIELVSDVLAISAPVEERVRRATARHLAEDDVRARIACQASDAEREAIARHAIVNDGSLEEYFAKLERYWHEVVEHVSE